MEISFIDTKSKDFLRDKSNQVVILKCSSKIQAYEWLKLYGEDIGWIRSTISTTYYFDWLTNSLV